MCTYLNRTGAKYYFRRPVPKDLIGHFLTESGGVRREWKLSLGVTSREEAKPRLPPHAAETDRLIAEARAARKQGEAATEWPDSRTGREAEEAEAQGRIDADKQARYAARREVRTLLRQRMRLSTEQLSPEEAAARDLMNEKGRDTEDLLREVAMLKANIIDLGGQPGHRPWPITKPVLLMDLFDGYASVAGARPATIAGFRSHVRAFISHSGIHDAARVELRHVLQWIDWLRTQPGRRGANLSEKTVRTSYLAALRLTLSYGVNKLLLPHNVMRDLKLMRAKKPQLNRERHFNEEERSKLLAAALIPVPGSTSAHVASARRWAPWLCAYTGARVGEVLQLRKSDVRQEDGIWAVHLTPVAGEIKTNSARWVPLHEHLISEGFLSWVEGQETERLFYEEPAADAPPRKSPPYQSVYNRLRTWIREYVPDPDVQPCHAWRHTMKSLARDYDMDSEIVDVIQGHSPATVGKAYGGTSMKARLRELEKLPRFNVGS